VHLLRPCATWCCPPTQSCRASASPPGEKQQQQPPISALNSASSSTSIAPAEPTLVSYRKHQPVAQVRAEQAVLRHFSQHCSGDRFGCAQSHLTRPQHRQPTPQPVIISGPRITQSAPTRSLAIAIIQTRNSSPALRTTLNPISVAPNAHCLRCDALLPAVPPAFQVASRDTLLTFPRSPP
jgi:hypothetical protein